MFFAFTPLPFWDYCDLVLGLSYKRRRLERIGRGTYCALLYVLVCVCVCVCVDVVMASSLYVVPAVGLIRFAVPVRNGNWFECGVTLK